MIISPGKDPVGPRPAAGFPADPGAVPASVDVDTAFSRTSFTPCDQMAGSVALRTVSSIRCVDKALTGYDVWP